MLYAIDTGSHWLARLAPIVPIETDARGVIGDDGKWLFADPIGYRTELRTGKKLEREVVISFVADIPDLHPFSTTTSQSKTIRQYDHQYFGGIYNSVPGPASDRDRLIVTSKAYQDYFCLSEVHFNLRGPAPNRNWLGFKDGADRTRVAKDVFLAPSSGEQLNIEYHGRRWLDEWRVVGPDASSRDWRFVRYRAPLRGPQKSFRKVESVRGFQIRTHVKKRITGGVIQTSKEAIAVEGFFDGVHHRILTTDADGWEIKDFSGRVVHKFPKDQELVAKLTFASGASIPKQVGAYKSVVHSGNLRFWLIVTPEGSRLLDLRKVRGWKRPVWSTGPI